MKPKLSQLSKIIFSLVVLAGLFAAGYFVGEYQGQAAREALMKESQQRSQMSMDALAYMFKLDTNSYFDNDTLIFCLSPSDDTEIIVEYLNYVVWDMDPQLHSVAPKDIEVAQDFLTENFENGRITTNDVIENLDKLRAFVDATSTDLKTEIFVDYRDYKNGVVSPTDFAG